MAIPKPKKGESSQDYVSRCMADATMITDYPATDARFAACAQAHEVIARNNVLSWNQEQGKVVPKLNELRHLVLSGLIKTTELDGKKYMVIPVVMICEGVHNGVYYPPEELAKTPDAWSGRPVVMWHPTLNDGTPVTANSPEIFTTQTVGMIFNVLWKDPKLHAEVWLEVDKAQSLEDGKKLLGMLNNKMNVEVSTGLFTDNYIESGEWNGEKYSLVARNYRPDHLALLPGGKGACSWEDGGGMPRVNEEEQHGGEVKNKESWFARLGKSLRSLTGNKVVENELSHTDLEGELRLQIKQLINMADTDWMWIQEVFDDYVIYGVEDVAGDKRQLYRVGYLIDAASDEVSLVGPSSPVTMKTEYVPTSNSKKTKITVEPEVAQKEKESMNKKKFVDALIANEKSNWTEEDREWLMGLEEAKLSKFSANEETEENSEEATVNEPVAPPKESEEESKEVPGRTAEDLLENEEIKEHLLMIQHEAKSRRDALISALDSNKSCKFTLARLEEMKNSDLLALSESLMVGLDFSGRVTAPATNGDDDDDKAPDMPKVNWAEAAK